MIKTGITSASYCGFSDYQSGFKKIREHGYDCIDYQEFASYANSPLYQMSEEEFSKYLTSVRLCAEENNLKIWQLHGTWPHVDDFSEEGREATVEYFKKCILGAFHLHCPHVVIHPCMFKGWGQGTQEEMFDVNVALLRKLVLGKDNIIFIMPTEPLSHLLVEMVKNLQLDLLMCLKRAQKRLRVMMLINGVRASTLRFN